MEQVFFRIHVRTSAIITKVFPRPVRYTVEVGSFFTAVLLLLLLSTLHLTFVNNEVTTRCFTSHVQQSYPNIGDGAVLTPMVRGWWKDTDIIRLRVQGWDLCAQPNAAAAGELKTSAFCDLRALGNYTNALHAFKFTSEHVDATLPPLYDTFSRLIGQHISTGPNPRDKRVRHVLQQQVEQIFSAQRVRLSCPQSNCVAADQASCTCPPLPGGEDFDGTVGELVAHSRRHEAEGSHVLLQLWDQFIADFVEDAVSMFAADSLYLFAMEKGYLMLSPALRAEHNISVLDVVMPKTSQCFRTSFDMLPHLTESYDDSAGFGLGIVKYAKNTLMGVPSIRATVQDPRFNTMLMAAFEYVRVPANYVIQNIIGYDAIVTNWMINLFNGKGFLFNVYSKDVFDVSRADTSGAQQVEQDGRCAADAAGYCELSTEDSRSGMSSPFVRAAVSFFQPTAEMVSFLPLFWQKLVILVSTMFLFFTTSTLVSFTLKETQERMLRFTYLLQYHIRQGIPVTKLVCTHLIESLVFVPIMVGIMGYLYEFFGDSMLTFMLLSMLWICECYTVVCVRTTTSAMLFPRFSFVLFCFFHFYSFSFPFGFSYVALATVSTMLWYIMVHFWNQYELPALLSGRINALNVRMMYQGGILSMIPESMHHLTSAAAESARDAGASVPVLTDEDIDGGSALSQIHDNAHNVAATRAQLMSKHRSPSNPPPMAGAKKNPRIPKQEQKHAHSSTDASFPPLPVPNRLKSGAGYSAAQPARGGGTWRPSRDSSGDNDYDVGLSLDTDDSSRSPRMAGKSPKAPLTVADQIELSRRIQAQEMEAAVNNMVIRTTSRLSVGRDLAGLGTPSSVDDFGYKKDEFSVFGANQDN